MRINLAQSGLTLPTLVSIGSQTAANDEESAGNVEESAASVYESAASVYESVSEDEQEQHSSQTTFEEVEGCSRPSSVAADREVAFTEPSTPVKDGMDKTDVPPTPQKRGKSKQKKKQTIREHSRKKSPRSSDLNCNDGQYGGTEDEPKDDDVRSTLDPIVTASTENKVFLMHNNVCLLSERIPKRKQCGQHKSDGHEIFFNNLG